MIFSGFEVDAGLKDDEIQWRIRNYRLLDNEFMLQVFSGRPDLVEHLLSVIWCSVPAGISPRETQPQ